MYGASGRRAAPLGSRRTDGRPGQDSITPPPPCLWPRWGPETTHAATGQRGELAAAAAGAYVPAGEEALPPSQALSKRQAGRTWRDPAHGEPHCSKHEGESPDLPCLHACFPFSVELSYLTLHLTMVGDWRVAHRSRQPGSLSRCSESVGNCLPSQVALPLHQHWHLDARYRTHLAEQEDR